MGTGRTAQHDSAEELYESAPCGYLSAEPDGTIVRVNQTFLDWTGHERETVLGARLQDLLTPGGRIYHETHYAPLLRMQGEVREIAVEIIRSDGSRLPALLNSVLALDAAGEPALVRTTIFDATDRREYERELQRARDREREARERMERLQGIGAALATSPLNRDAIAAAVATELENHAGAVGAAVGLLGGEGRVRAFGGRGATRGLLDTGPDGRPLPGTAAARALEELATVVQEDAHGVLVAAPLLTEGRPVGVLTVRVPQGSETLAAEPAFLDACASQCAHALEHARLYEEERDVAETLQRSLLAVDAPSDERFRVAAHYSPGDDSLEVGGDWFDVFCLGDDSVAVVVGDVVGRGLDAATTMGQLRSAIRALALADPSPSAVLGHLDSFSMQAPGAQVATVVYAELSLEDGVLRYACAGHPPPVLTTPGASTELLWEGRSEPLGVRISRDPRPEATRRLSPGARILLYTDGLVERRTRTFDERLALLAREVDARAREVPARLVSGLTGAMKSDGAAGDDVCLLCLELLPAAT